VPHGGSTDLHPWQQKQSSQAHAVEKGILHPHVFVPSVTTVVTRQQLIIFMIYNRIFFEIKVM
jgi:hypothetical protein